MVDVGERAVLERNAAVRLWMMPRSMEVVCALVESHRAHIRAGLGVPRGWDGPEKPHVTMGTFAPEPCGRLGMLVQLLWDHACENVRNYPCPYA
jgi:hypothetical protein